MSWQKSQHCRPFSKDPSTWLQSVDSPCGYKLHTQFEQRQDQQPEERMFLKSKSIHGLGCRSSLEIAESKHMVRAWMRWKADRVRCMAAGLNRIDSIIWVVGHWHFHEVCLNYPSNRQRKQKISSVHKQYTHLKVLKLQNRQQLEIRTGTMRWENKFAAGNHEGTCTYFDEVTGTDKSS
jgi:hypothetical protein